MASVEHVAKRLHKSHVRAAEILAEHASEERREGLSWLSPNGSPPNPRNTWELAAYQAEMIAALAEMVEDLSGEVAELKAGKSSKSGSSKK